MYAWQENKAHHTMTFKIQHLDKNMQLKLKLRIQINIKNCWKIMSFKESPDIN